MRLATPFAVLAVLLAALSGCGGSSSGESGARTETQPRAGASTSPAGASARSCPLDAGGASALRATGVSCGEAQRLAIAWQRSSGCGGTPGASHIACTVRGYRCIASATGRGLSVSCARPGHSVAFTVRG